VTNERTFNLGSNPCLVFRSCFDDLHIQGWGKPQVQLLLVDADEEPQLREEQGTLEISANVPLTAHVPTASSVLLEGCAGDVRAIGFQQLHASSHRGDVSVARVESVELDTISGDGLVHEGRSVRASSVNGDLSILSVQDDVSAVSIRGDVALTSVRGSVEVRAINGDVSIRNPGGHLRVGDVNGSIELAGNLQSGEYELESIGDVTLYVDRASSARLKLEAPRGQIASSLEFTRTLESAHVLEGSLGNAVAEVRALSTAGDIRLRGKRASEVQQAVEEEVARAEHWAHRAAERAQHLAEKLQRRSERRERRVHRRAEHVARKAQGLAALGRAAAQRAAGRAPVNQAAVQEERLAVLRMLSQGQINAAQAEKLLAALED
jgi:hypothetical protein